MIYKDICKLAKNSYKSILGDITEAKINRLLNVKII